MGCDNIIRLCEEYRVESCIFSSTGKASRYFTPDSHVFLGQLDLSGDREILPMLNVLEADRSEISQARDMVISETIPFDADILDRSISQIEAALVSTDSKIEQTVIESQKEIVLSSFVRANPVWLLDILKWGVSAAENRWEESILATIERLSHYC